MKVVIDTSSLLSLVRYYLPFDNKNILINLFEEKIKNGDIVILDLVYNECIYTSNGIVIKNIAFLENKKLHNKTDEILPNKKFFNQLENQFINGSVRNKLDDTEFENRKHTFLNSADAKLLLFCLKNNDYSIITEETISSNDNKSFKKIPAIAKIIGINVITLPEYIDIIKEISLKIE